MGTIIIHADGRATVRFFFLILFGRSRFYLPPSLLIVYTCSRTPGIPIIRNLGLYASLFFRLSLSLCLSGFSILRPSLFMYIYICTLYRLRWLFLKIYNIYAQHCLPRRLGFLCTHTPVSTCCTAAQTPGDCGPLSSYSRRGAVRIYIFYKMYPLADVLFSVKRQRVFFDLVTIRRIVCLL